MRLWFELRDRRLRGIKFRRQYSVGPYVVDFYCAKTRLAVELDGDSHFTRRAELYDADRQRYIEACGITVLRFTNDEVYRSMEQVLEKLVTVVVALKPAAASTSP
ncbi:MAG: endonuclease domain-containing protein [Candidatus Andersenbacteria bacterium]|nr:endonuclease domain-containing protein [Candidatus Andersenbacteria bacterium]